MQALAPAKVNLTLNVMGRREDGYHMLQSLVTFTDIGDEITMVKSKDMIFDVSGPFAGDFSKSEIRADNQSANLVIKAIHLLQNHFNIYQNFSIKMVKNLPLSSGIGGGTSDAACAVRMALKSYNVKMTDSLMQKLTQHIGADFPVCYHCKPAMIYGIGDVIQPLEDLPVMHMVLVNPLKPCPTANVFQSRGNVLSNAQPLQNNLKTNDALTSYIKSCGNDLTDAAVRIVPEIKDVLRELRDIPDCEYAEMSGSGATCFGLFGSMELATHGCALLREHYPDWWVQCGQILPPCYAAD